MWGCFFGFLGLCCAASMMRLSPASLSAVAVRQPYTAMSVRLLGVVKGKLAQVTTPSLAFVPPTTLCVFPGAGQMSPPAQSVVPSQQNTPVSTPATVHASVLPQQAISAPTSIMPPPAVPVTAPRSSLGTPSAAVSHPLDPSRSKLHNRRQRRAVELVEPPSPTLPNADDASAKKGPDTKKEEKSAAQLKKEKEEYEKACLDRFRESIVSHTKKERAQKRMPMPVLPGMTPSDLNSAAQDLCKKIGEELKKAHDDTGYQGKEYDDIRKNLMCAWGTPPKAKAPRGTSVPMTQRANVSRAKNQAAPQREESLFEFFDRRYNEPDGRASSPPE